jgi:hypothetical protein
MKKSMLSGFVWLSVLLFVTSFSHAQYKGKYVGWSAGYLFTGSLSPVMYKAFTHLFNFQATVSGTSANTGSLAMNSTTFVATCHANGVKAIVCIGGAGESGNFSNACATASGQTALVKSIVNIVRTNKYDGVDLDWEEGETGGFDGNAAKVAMFKSFHKELRDSINTMNPRPLYTAAVATDWYPNGTAAIAEYLDQMNNMSYYNRVADMDRLFKPVLDKGVSKSIQGVGYGWDTDNEITDPVDIIAKCKYAIDNGYGGIMAWHVAGASRITPWILDSISHYVTHATVNIADAPFLIQGERRILLNRNNGGKGQANEIFISLPANVISTHIRVGVYNTQGRFIKSLYLGSKPF